MNSLFARIAAPLLIALTTPSYADDAGTFELVNLALTMEIGHPLNERETEFAKYMTEIITSRTVITPITRHEWESGLTYIFDPNIEAKLKQVDPSDKTQLENLIPRKGAL